MRDYSRVSVVRAGEVDKYLKGGWEVITTSTIAYDDGSTNIEYHVGLPSKILVEELLKIIRDYEQNGLKEELFKKIASELGENLDAYGESTGHPTDSKLARYLEDYERVVNDRITRIYKNYTQEEIEEMFG